MSLIRVQAVLFDKDGTLFEYSKTWDSWCDRVVSALSDGDSQLEKTLCNALGFDFASRVILPHSVVIAGSTIDLVETVLPFFPNMTASQMEAYLNGQVVNLPLQQATPLKPFFAELRRLGVKTGVMTNDSEQSAHDQLGSVDVAYPNDLDFVAGYDSGFGAKPNPDPLLAFAKKVSVEPDRCAMVGDSVHDLLAGRRAQMQTIGVLTGLATEADLSPYADLVLRDISHIPHALGRL